MASSPASPFPAYSAKCLAAPGAHHTVLSGVSVLETHVHSGGEVLLFSVCLRVMARDRDMMQASSERMFDGE